MQLDLWWTYTDLDLEIIPHFGQMGYECPTTWPSSDRVQWRCAREQLWAIKQKLVNL